MYRKKGIPKKPLHKAPAKTVASVFPLHSKTNAPPYGLKGFVTYFVIRSFFSSANYSVFVAFASVNSCKSYKSTVCLLYGSPCGSLRAQGLGLSFKSPTGSKASPNPSFLSPTLDPTQKKC